MSAFGLSVALEQKVDQALAQAGAESSIVIGENTVAVATIQVSSADILSMHSMPIELVPAPGENKILWPLAFAATYLFGTVAYTGGGGSGQQLIQYEGSSSFTSITGDIFTQEQSKFSFDAYGANRDLAAVVNKALVLHDAVDDYIDGDGTAIIRVTFAVIDLN